jgi:copper(I)-binding protein
MWSMLYFRNDILHQTDAPAVTYRLTMLAGAVLLPFLVLDAGAAEPLGPRIDRAWARATPGSARTGAAYFSIKSPIDDRLIGLASPVARKAELHTHIERDGVMRMQAVEGGLAVAANQELELKPGGLLHVMLIDLNRKLQAGDRFQLVLTFEQAGPREVTVKVEPLGAMGPSDDAGIKPNVMHDGTSSNQATLSDGNPSSERRGP